MSHEKSAYRRVFKATSLFGGVQLFRILISVIRSKAVALLIGPAGMGVVSLFNAAVDLLSAFTRMGLETSAVKDVSAAHGSGDQARVVRIVAIVRRLVWATGLLGMLGMLVFSRGLSCVMFGSYDYTWGFVWLSVVLLFKQLTAANMVVLQGLRKLRHLAQANLLGNLTGLLLALPLYYFFRMDAIVPVIIITFLAGYGFSRYYVRKTPLETVPIGFGQAWSEGRGMLRMGLMLSLSGLLGTLTAWLVQVFINHTGGDVQVGYYAAGMVIINSYVGMIFNAMAADYYPRLAAIAHDPAQVRQTVLHQAYIGLLLVTPGIVLFLAVAPQTVQLLYSGDFLPVAAFLVWAIPGTLFKTVSFSMGYIFIAKGDSRIFIKTAVGFNLLLLAANLLGYHYGGITGLGIGFLLYYGLHFALVGIITKRAYNFYFPAKFYALFAVCLVLTATCFMLNSLDNTLQRYVLQGIILTLSAVISYRLLDKKMEISASLRKVLKRKKKD